MSCTSRLAFSVAVVACAAGCASAGFSLVLERDRVIPGTDRAFGGFSQEYPTVNDAGVLAGLAMTRASGDLDGDSTRAIWTFGPGGSHRLATVGNDSPADRYRWYTTSEVTADGSVVAVVASQGVGATEIVRLAPDRSPHLIAATGMPMRDYRGFTTGHYDEPVGWWPWHDGTPTFDVTPSGSVAYTPVLAPPPVRSQTSSFHHDGEDYVFASTSPLAYAPLDSDTIPITESLGFNEFGRGVAMIWHRPDPVNEPEEYETRVHVVDADLDARTVDVTALPWSTEMRRSGYLVRDVNRGGQALLAGLEEEEEEEIFGGSPGAPLVLLDSDSTPRELFRSRDTIDGLRNFRIHGAHLTDAGLVVVDAFDTASSGGAIAAFDPATGTASVLVSVGMPMFGSVIADELTLMDVSSGGTIAFGATLADGRLVYATFDSSTLALIPALPSVGPLAIAFAMTTRRRGRAAIAA